MTSSGSPNPSLPPSPIGDEAMPCPQCGYDLRAAASDCCCECGWKIDRELLTTSGFPWAHRRRVGRIRAYIKTVWMVTVGSRRLAYEAARPQELADARKFGWITTVIFALSLLGVFAAAVVAQKGLIFLAVQPVSPFAGAFGAAPAGFRLPDDLAVPWSAGATLWPVLPACLVLLAIYLGRVQRAIFRVRSFGVEYQRRALALAAYASAPLALAGLALVLYLLGSIIDPGALRAGSWPDLTVVHVLATAMRAASLALPPAILLLRCAQWLQRATARGGGRAALGAAELLGLWLVGIVVCLGLLPWCVGFLWIVIDSLR
jgi:hypothetical protein